MKLPSTQFQGSDRGVQDRKNAGAELIFSLDTRARHSTSALLSAAPLSQISKYARVEAKRHASLFEQALTLLLIKVQLIQSRAVARTRSEERRVGKECREKWKRKHGKTNATKGQNE